jgi:hypothetical protein
MPMKILQNIMVVEWTTLNTSIDRKVYNVEQDIMSCAGLASDIKKHSFC